MQLARASNAARVASTYSSRLLPLTSRDPATRQSASTLVGLRPADVHHVVVVVVMRAKKKQKAAKRTRIIVSRSQT
jgi:hypothetical protein